MFWLACRWNVFSLILAIRKSLSSIDVDVTFISMMPFLTLDRKSRFLRKTALALRISNPIISFFELKSIISPSLSSDE